MSSVLFDMIRIKVGMVLGMMLALGMMSSVLSDLSRIKVGMALGCDRARKRDSKNQVA